MYEKLHWSFLKHGVNGLEVACLDKESMHDR